MPPRHVEKISLATMLATKRSVGVAPEVNLGNVCLCQVQIRLPILVFKPRRDVTRSLKQGISGPTKRTYVLQKILKNDYVNFTLFPTIENDKLRFRFRKQ